MVRGLITVLEMAGLVIYVLGYLLMAWALIKLGSNYQLGGSTPRSRDKMVMDGPYRWVRHPMYTAALNISLGLACPDSLLGFPGGIWRISFIDSLADSRGRRRIAAGVHQTIYPLSTKNKKTYPFCLLIQDQE